MNARVQIPTKPVAAPARCLPSESRRSRAPLREASAPPPSSAGWGHDFSRVRVNVPAEAEARLAEVGCLGLLHQDAAGDTGCDVSTGTPTTVIHAPSLCYKACTERHEAVHATDLNPCCKRANKAYNAAPTDGKKTAVQDKMNEWVLKNKDYLECRGYAESVRCGEEFLAAHCGATQSNAMSQSSSGGENHSETAPPKTGTEATDLDRESKGALVSERLPEASLAEDKPADAIDPKICCATVKEYVRKHRLHRDAWCAAKKNLTACPFPA